MSYSDDWKRPRLVLLRCPRRRLAGAERFSRRSQRFLNPPCNPPYNRVRATEHATSSPFCFLERLHGLAEIAERGAVVHVERLRVNPSHLKRDPMFFSESASRQGHRFAQQCFDFVLHCTHLRRRGRRPPSTPCAFSSPRRRRTRGGPDNTPPSRPRTRTCAGFYWRYMRRPAARRT